MDIRLAARESRQLISYAQEIKVEGGEATGLYNIHEMLSLIEDGKVSGEKAHRWLGWAQGVLCCYGAGTLEQFKQINSGASSLDTQPDNQIPLGEPT